MEVRPCPGIASFHTRKIPLLQLFRHSMQEHSDPLLRMSVRNKSCSCSFLLFRIISSGLENDNRPLQRRYEFFEKHVFRLTSAEKPHFNVSKQMEWRKNPTLNTHNNKHSQVSTWECPYFLPIQFPISSYFLIVPFCYNRMYGGFTYPKSLCGLSHGSIVVDNIISNAHSTLFDIISQKEPLRILFYIVWEDNIKYNRLLLQQIIIIYHFHG